MKVTLYCGWKKVAWQDEPELTVWNSKYVDKENGYSNCSVIEVDIPAPECPSQSELVQAQIKDLRRQKGLLVSDADLIESMIQNLLCIEYKAEA